MTKILNLTNNSQKFDFNDISIIPFEQGGILSRNNIFPFNNSQTGDRYLPIIVSPMYSCFTLDEKHFNVNFDDLLNLNHIPFCYTRNTKNVDSLLVNNKNNYVSKSLQEFEYMVNTTEKGKLEHNKVLIDIANGHMKKLHDLVKLAKDKYGDNLKVMVGNVANPKTFKILCDYGVDSVRISVGSGSVCTTSANSAVHYPIASLIYECSLIKKEYGYTTEIIADGGFSNFSDIIKAIGLGADYVMMGSIFAKCLEANSALYAYKKFKINNLKLAKLLYKYKIPLYRKHIGMSTKYIQKLWKKDKLRTSEGIIKWVKVEHTLSKWRENFVDYLKNTMSYTNSNNLKDFRDNCEFVFITKNAYERFKK